MKIDRFLGDYSFLSNFYLVNIQVGNRVWPSVEHYYQAMKSLDVRVQEDIRSCSTAKEAKMIGKRILLREDWDQVKIQIMRRALISKFSVPTLRDKLLHTGNVELIEGNYWHDNFWGRCWCDSCKYKSKRNQLGNLLMWLREGIKNGKIM